MGYCYLVFFVILPIFILSRLFPIFFPIISLIHHKFDVESIRLFPWLLTAVYAFITICWCVAFVTCMPFYYWTTHLFPGNDGYSWNEASNGLRLLNLMQKYYDKRNDYKYMELKRIHVVIEMLGRDIGGLVISYLPRSQFNLKQMLFNLREEYRYMLHHVGDAQPNSILA